MNLPKFILGDNTDHPEAIYIVHTEFPRFILNLEDDEVEWVEDFTEEDVRELEEQAAELIGLASAFYDREVSRYIGQDAE